MINRYSARCRQGGQPVAIREGHTEPISRGFYQWSVSHDVCPVTLAAVAVQARRVERENKRRRVKG